MGRPLPEYGLTFSVHPNDIRPGSGQPWIVSEVYVGEIIARAFPTIFPRSQYIADIMVQQRTIVGRLIANVAFHEALHNKLEPRQPSGFDMHSLGGIAAGGNALHENLTTATRNLMRQRLHQNLERQYVFGVNQLS
jgi:hypothetical protein